MLKLAKRIFASRFHAEVRRGLTLAKRQSCTASSQRAEVLYSCSMAG